MLSWISTHVLSCLGLVMMVMMMMMVTVRVEGFPSGAPNFACNSMRPTHPQKSQPEKTFPVHVVLSPATIWPGDIVDVKVVAREPSFRFLGMLTTVHEVVSDIRGNSRPTLLPGFTLTNSSHFKLINCVGRSGGSETGLTHIHRLQTDRASFRWTVPDTALVGTTYALRFTIVENFFTYWVAVNTTFTIGQPPLRPISPQRRPTGAGSASQVTSPLSSMNGQQLRESSMNGQQQGPSATNGQQQGPSATNGQQGRLSLMHAQQPELSSLNRQQQSGQSSVNAPQARRQPQLNTPTAAANTNGQHAGTSPLTSQQQNVPHSNGRPSSSAAGVGQQPFPQQPTATHNRPRPQNSAPGRTDRQNVTGTSRTQNVQTQTNLVTGGSLSQGTTAGTGGSSNRQEQSRNTGSGSGNGDNNKMSAWLAGWFG